MLSLFGEVEGSFVQKESNISDKSVKDNNVQLFDTWSSSPPPSSSYLRMLSLTSSSGSISRGLACLSFSLRFIHTTNRSTIPAGGRRTDIRRLYEIKAAASRLKLSFKDGLFVRLVLTEQDDDADEDGDDGPRAEAGGRHGPRGAAVPVVITGTHFDSDQGAVGQRRVP